MTWDDLEAGRRSALDELSATGPRTRTWSTPSTDATVPGCIASTGTVRHDARGCAADNARQAVSRPQEAAESRETTGDHRECREMLELLPRKAFRLSAQLSRHRLDTARAALSRR